MPGFLGLPVTAPRDGRARAEAKPLAKVVWKLRMISLLAAIFHMLQALITQTQPDSLLM